MQALRSTWAGRFIGATFILGGVAWLVITLLVLGNLLSGMEPPNFALGPASSRMVASPGATAWFVMGLLSFLVIGIVGIGLSALFYNHLESTLAAPVSGWRNLTAWLHLGLGGGGASAASLIMAYSGYRAGVALLAPEYGGLGEDNLYVHANILQPAVIPIAGLMLVALLGYLVGGIGLGTAWWNTRKARPAE
jgi:hypothetical protein